MKLLRPPALAALLLAAGCSSAAAPTAPVATSPPQDGGSYANADALLAALAAANVPCTNPSPIANPTAPGALSMSGCFSPQGAGGQDSDSVVVVFDNHADAQSFAESMVDPGLANAAGDATEEVIGVNWVVNTEPAYGTQVQAALGGSDLVATPTVSAS